MNSLEFMEEFKAAHQHEKFSNEARKDISNELEEKLNDRHFNIDLTVPFSETKEERADLVAKAVFFIQEPEYRELVALRIMNDSSVFRSDCRGVPPIKDYRPLVEVVDEVPKELPHVFQRRMSPVDIKEIISMVDNAEGYWWVRIDEKPLITSIPLLVKVAGKKNRLVFDHRPSNKLAKLAGTTSFDAAYQLKFLLALLEEYHRSGYTDPRLFVADLCQAFRQIAIDDPKGLYGFELGGKYFKHTTAPMGGLNSTFYLAEVLNKHFADLILLWLQIFADNMAMVSPDERTNVDRFFIIAERCKEKSIVLNLKDLRIAAPTVTYVGFEIGMFNVQNQMVPGVRKKVGKIIQFLESVEEYTNYGLAMQLLHKSQYAGSHAKRMKSIILPLQKLLADKPKDFKSLKNIPLETVHKPVVKACAIDVYKILNEELCVFRAFRSDFPLCIISDASDFSMSALIVQYRPDEANLNPLDRNYIILDILHHSFNSREAKYHIFMKELMANMMAVVKYPEWFLQAMKPIHCYTDNEGNKKKAEKPFTGTSTILGKAERLLADLLDIQVTLEYIPGVWNIADEFSRMGEVQEIEAPVYRLDDLKANILENFINVNVGEGVMTRSQSRKSSLTNPDVNEVTKEDIEIEEVQIEDGKITKIKLDDLEKSVRKIFNPEAVNFEVLNLIRKYSSPDQPHLKTDNFEAGIWFRTIGEKTLILVPFDANLRNLIIAIAHDGYAGHPFEHLTELNVRKHFYWSSISKDVRYFVRGCAVCKITKPPHKANIPLGIRIVSEPFERVAFDYAYIKTQSLRGNKYAMVIVDVYSLFMHLVAVPDMEAPTAVAAILEFCRYYPCPIELFSDQGKNFTSKVVKGLADNLKSSQLFTFANIPFTRGKSEAAVKVMEEKLTTFITSILGNSREWDDYLPEVKNIINSLPSASLQGYSPLEVVHGISRAPIDKLILFDKELGRIRKIQLNQSNMDHLSNLASIRNRIYRKYEVALEKNSKAFENHVAVKQGRFPLKPKQRALVATMNKEELPSSFTPRWSEIVTIKTVLNPWSYIVENVLSKETKEVHAICLRPFDETKFGTQLVSDDRILWLALMHHDISYVDSFKWVGKHLYCLIHKNKSDTSSWELVSEWAKKIPSYFELLIDLVSDETIKREIARFTRIY